MRFKKVDGEVVYVPRGRAERRHNDFTKALRKVNIIRSVEGGQPGQLHYYCKGYVGYKSGCRFRTDNLPLTYTYGRLGNNYKPSDKRKVISMIEQYKEYCRKGYNYDCG